MIVQFNWSFYGTLLGIVPNERLGLVNLASHGVKAAKKEHVSIVIGHDMIGYN